MASKPAPKQQTDLIVPPPSGNEAAALLSMIGTLAKDPAVPVERMQQLFHLLKEIQTEDARKAFTAAFPLAQAEMEPVRKDAKSDKGKYATHLALDSAIRPAYTKHGFGVSFDSADSPLQDHVRLLCILMHTSGYERTYHLDVPADGKGAKGNDVMTKTHAVGSATTYGKRYLLGMVWNIAVHDRADDDGKAASDTGETVSDAQIAALQKLVAEIGGEEKAFLTYAKVESWDEIRARDFHRHHTALKKRLQHGST